MQTLSFFGLTEDFSCHRPVTRPLIVSLIAFYPAIYFILPFKSNIATLITAIEHIDYRLG